ncbi:intercellular adhesion molecule 1 isoform X2 [Moschus berezovskii]|uniref:intercellular adhesion molecule 1 isoform X2 n=1 Tax=Moschus berezovskii TaxID=68408 RepID=UPI0024445910|nr:intercellular adhesion molecule 1 isoform X2 [Moschus berezovskii]
MAPGAAPAARLALLALLGVLLPGPGGARTSIYPSKAIIPRGGSLRVNCSISCDQKATFGLETELTKKEVDRGNNWKVFELSDVQEDISLLCYSNCHSEQTVASMNLTVYWFPEHVELALLPLWQPVGEELNLSCQVSGGAPRDHLSVVLLRGEEELGRQPLGKGEPAEVRFTVQPRREDHGTSFSCRWELDLRSQGLELFQNTSAPRKLQTYVLPSTDPHLEAPPVVEVGSRWPVKCMLDGLFPASDAEVYLVLGDQKLESNITYSGDSVLAKAWMEENEEGTHSLKCSVSLGEEARRTRGNVTIYSFPVPTLTLSPPEVSEWTTVTVECVTRDGALVKLNGVSAEPPGPRAQMKLNVSADDHGNNFSCSAALEIAGQVVHKNQTRELHVLYGPRLDQRDCLGNWTWQEGSEQTLKCEARGNPIPKLNCSRKGDGASLPIGDLRPVKREVAGTYLCRATSTRAGQNILDIVIPVVAVILILGALGTAGYIYNYQRKIQKYELQKARKAQEEAALKLNAQSTPP